MKFMDGIFLNTFVTLLMVMDPFGVSAVFISLTKDDTKQERLKTARKACVVAVILLGSFAFLGDALFDALGISEPAFRITGGFFLLLMGMQMVTHGHVGPSSRLSAVEAKEAVQKDDISVFPLAIPLIAGPGSITSMVILMRQAELYGIFTQFCVVLMMIVCIFGIYLCFYCSNFIARFLGVTGTNVMTRVFGIVLAALAFQNILTGIECVIKMHL
ncbi:MAG: MarC family protein [Alphaproteobacteria bacterium]